MVVWWMKEKVVRHFVGVIVWGFVYFRNDVEGRYEVVVEFVY